VQLEIPEVRAAMNTLVYVSGDAKLRAEAEARQDALNNYYSAMTVAEG
jgi:hypothetical protein